VREGHDGVRWGNDCVRIFLRASHDPQGGAGLPAAEREGEGLLPRDDAPAGWCAQLQRLCRGEGQLHRLVLACVRTGKRASRWGGERALEIEPPGVGGDLRQRGAATGDALVTARIALEEDIHDRLSRSNAGRRRAIVGQYTHLQGALRQRRRGGERAAAGGKQEEAEAEDEDEDEDEDENEDGDGDAAAGRGAGGVPGGRGAQCVRLAAERQSLDQLKR
jgi:hypothetical protein